MTARKQGQRGPDKKPRKRMGRTAYTLTPAKILQAEQMASVGMTLPQIAAGLGWSYSHLRKQRDASEELTAALEKGRAQGLHAVANALYQAAISGSVPAQMFYLKCRDQDNWQDKGGQDDHPTPIDRVNVRVIEGGKTG